MLTISEERILQVEKIEQRTRSSREITWDRKKQTNKKKTKKSVWLEQSKQVGNESDLRGWGANIIEPHRSL